MTRFRSASRQAVGLVFSHNEYGLVHESVKASIKSFKDHPEVYEFQLILESMEKQANVLSIFIRKVKQPKRK